MSKAYFQGIDALIAIVFALIFVVAASVPAESLAAAPQTHASIVDALLLAQDPAAPLEMSPIQQFLSNPLVLPIGLLVLFYVIFLGPERRRKAEEAKLLASIKKNDRVVTIGGIHATVANVTSDSDIVTLKIDENSNTRLRVNRSAIAKILSESSDKSDKPDKSTSTGNDLKTSDGSS